MAIDKLMLELAEEGAKRAHRIYLDNWETKTQHAENDGKWDYKIHFRTIQAIEALASNQETLAHALTEVIKQFEIIDEEN